MLELEGFAQRMEALRAKLTPKLEAVGQALLPDIEEATGRTFFVHVARHARRTVNPPKDTWVALSELRRGYKMVPHFSVGLFRDRLFVRVGALYEAPDRTAFAASLAGALKDLPADAEIIFDHQQPGGVSAARLVSTPEQIVQSAGRRQGEVLLERSRRSAEVAGEDVLRVIRPLLPPLFSVYNAWRAGAEIA